MLIFREFFRLILLLPVWIQRQLMGAKIDYWTDKGTCGQVLRSREREALAPGISSAMPRTQIGFPEKEEKFIRSDQANFPNSWLVITMMATADTPLVEAAVKLTETQVLWVNVALELGKSEYLSGKFFSRT